MADAPHRSEFTETGINNSFENINCYFAESNSAQSAAEVGTGPPAQALLSQCGLLPKQPPGAVVLDIACGNGTVTALLMQGGGSQNGDLKVICGDLDMTMVDMAAKRIEKNGWRAEAKLLDAQAIPYDDGYFSHVLMNFGPQLMSDPVQALKETHRVLREGGCTGFTCWLKAGWIPSVQEIVPSFTAPPSMSGAWANPEAIKENLASLGFSNIETNVLDFKTNFENVEDYLELMKLLLKKVLVGETADAYDQLMRGKHERGEMGMEWQALIVSAVKTPSA